MEKTYTLICKRCGKKFKTTNWRRQYCDDCREIVTREIKRKNMQKSRKKKRRQRFIPIHEFMLLKKAYSEKHGDISYGQFESKIHNGEIEI